MLTLSLLKRFWNYVNKIIPTKPINIDNPSTNNIYKFCASII